MKYVPTKIIDVEHVGKVTIRQLTLREVNAMRAEWAKGAEVETATKIDVECCENCVINWPDGPPENVQDIAHEAFKTIVEEVMKFSGIVAKEEEAPPTNLPTTPID